MAYIIKDGDALSRIAAANNTDVATLQKLNPSITDPNKIFAGQSLELPPLAAPATTPITNPVTAPNTGTASTPGPTLPKPTAPAANETYVNSLTAEAAANRKAVEDRYKSELAGIDTQRTAAQTKIDEYTTKQEGVLGDVNDLTRPFRQTLEETERKRLYVDENFQANQKLVGELDSLLTDGNEIIKRQREEGGLASVAVPKLNQTISDINARAGVIQAVIAARNGQISQAYTMIDRTARAIDADRQDRLSYYKALDSFYSNEKDAQGKKLITLDSDKKKFLAAQIGLLEQDADQSQKNVDYIKGLMQDPKTALTVAQAGVTLKDTPEQVNAKLAEQEYREQRAKLINDQATKGYVFMATDAQAGAHPQAEMVTVVDAKGNKLKFWNPPTAKASTPSSNNTDPAAPGNKASRNEILAGLKLPLTTADSGGRMTQSALNRVVDQGGVPINVATAIWKNIMDGATLEEIRTGMASLKGTDGNPVFTKDEAYGYLDKFMQALQT